MILPYSPPWPLRNPHINTCLPLFLKNRDERSSAINNFLSIEETIPTPDGDTLSVTHLNNPTSSMTVILTHGLEGSANSNYVTSLTKELLNSGFSITTWDMRGCGKSSSNLLTWYHSGDTSDLRLIIAHEQLREPKKQISLVGFSVGGNITLKYLGEEGEAAKNVIDRSVCISVPIDLEGSSNQLAHRKNVLYMKYLLAPLKKRITARAERFPEMINHTGLSGINTFKEFDTRYTAPIHGFSSVLDYWRSQSSKQYLSRITVPTLLINAKDDPFLSESCSCAAATVEAPRITYESPEYGGHVGFLESVVRTSRWSDRRVVQFLSE